MPEYPMVALLVFVEDKVEPDTAAGLEQLAAELVQSRDWAGEPPEFVDDVDSAGVRTCGVLLWLTDVRAPEAATVPAELDRRELADVKVLVDALVGFSARTGLTIGIEYGGDSAGWIEAGQPDKLVREALIGEWERRLAG
ncbi:hypothetical protein KZZ52_26715 [Dactylosporangium sp. AC04546]|uniref:hypothetical protein n=1 Tax=Dactylosporangium sp. AC04546 TaxID=2862460 RepID=UPI001EDDF117|nr:hypothetical protein [Dactylosporangium sp. AC04546]WVK88861.1 hypothetical protein KZZ52_26715 [Dactylosporangium sp. AC04546]